MYIIFWWLFVCSLYLCMCVSVYKITFKIKRKKNALSSPKKFLYAWEPDWVYVQSQLVRSGREYDHITTITYARTDKYVQESPVGSWSDLLVRLCASNWLWYGHILGLIWRVVIGCNHDPIGLSRTRPCLLGNANISYPLTSHANINPQISFIASSVDINVSWNWSQRCAVFIEQCHHGAQIISRQQLVDLQS